MKSNELMDRLKVRYGGNGHAVIREVGNGTGMNCNRHADALAMSLWPSRGLELLGFELKVSRTDWLKELKSPQKADDIFGYCDRWYLVVSDSKIVLPGELPPTWGLLAAHGTGLKAVTEAPKLKPRAIDRAFLAAIFRRVVEQTADVETLKAATKEAYENGKAETDSMRTYEREQHAKLQERVRQFEEASGVNIDAYYPSADKIGAAVKAVLRGEHIPTLERLQRIRGVAAGIVEDIDNSMVLPKEQDAA